MTGVNRENVISFNADKSCILCGESGSTEGSFCLECIGFSSEMKVPKPGEFRNEKHEDIDFLLAPDLSYIGQRLIENYQDDFGALDEAEIDYFWKRQGGSSAGRSVLGKFIKVSGVIKYYSKKDYICWLAADHCYSFDLYKITATIFHELCHGWYNVGNGNWDLQGHIFEGFPREIEVFGPWRSGAQLMQNSFEQLKQPRLFKSK